MLSLSIVKYLFRFFCKSFYVSLWCQFTVKGTYVRVCPVWRLFGLLFL